MGGRKIDDHRFFAGEGSPDFPDGVHVKKFDSADGAGELDRYEDTSEEIQRVQEEGEKQIKRRPMKSGYRY